MTHVAFVSRVQQLGYRAEYSDCGWHGSWHSNRWSATVDQHTHNDDRLSGRLDAESRS